MEPVDLNRCETCGAQHVSPNMTGGNFFACGVCVGRIYTANLCLVCQTVSADLVRPRPMRHYWHPAEMAEAEAVS